MITFRLQIYACVIVTFRLQIYTCVMEMFRLWIYACAIGTFRLQIYACAMGTFRLRIYACMTGMFRLRFIQVQPSYCIFELFVPLYVSILNPPVQLCSLDCACFWVTGTFIWRFKPVFKNIVNVKIV